MIELDTRADTARPRDPLWAQSSSSNLLASSQYVPVTILRICNQPNVTWLEIPYDAHRFAMMKLDTRAYRSRPGDPLWARNLFKLALLLSVSLIECSKYMYLTQRRMASYPLRCAQTRINET